MNDQAEIVELALTLHGEARGEPIRSKVAVAWVIRNRKEMGYGPTYRSVCRAPKQFSCWDSSPNRREMLERQETQAWLESLAVAAHVYHAPASLNPLPGVTHYHDKSINPPYWARNAEEVTIPDVEAFRFYRGVDRPWPKEDK